MPEKVPELKTDQNHRPRRIFLLVSLALAIVLVVGNLLFLAYSQGLFPFLSSIQNPSLGSDAVTVLKKADELRKKSNYLVEYEVRSKNSLEATASAVFRRVERKYKDLSRIDFYFGSAGVSSQYFVNDQGKYACLNFKDPNEPPCYDLTKKMDESEKKLTSVAPDWNLTVMSDWLSQQAATASVQPQTVTVNGLSRSCEQVNLTLTGKSLTPALLEKLTQYFPTPPTAQSLEEASKLLERAAVTAATCYDRVTGLPLKNERTVTLDQTQQVVRETALYLNLDPVFTKSLTSRPIVSAGEAKSRSFQVSLVDGPYLYLAGENGLYIFKDGKLEKHDAEVTRSLGPINDLVSFQGKLYLTGRGFYSYAEEKLKEEMDYLKTFGVYDFIIFDGSLFAATGKGTRILQEGAWQQPNDSFSSLGSASRFAAAGGKLYLLTNQGVYLFSEGRWKKIFSIDSYGTRRLIESGGRIFLAEPGKLTEIDDGKITPLVNYRGPATFSDAVDHSHDVVAVSETGLYSTRQELNLKKERTGWARDLIIFQGALYAAADHGVYRLADDAWTRLNGFDLSQADLLFEFKNNLYVGAVLGAYQITAEEVLQSPLSEVDRFFTDGQRLYTSSLEGSVLHEVTAEKGDPQEAFDLPKDAKIKNL